MRARSNIAALVVVAMMSGCSFMAVRGHRSRGANCTSSHVAPTIDTGLAFAAAIAAIGGLSWVHSYKNEEGDGGVAGVFVAIPGAILSLPYTASAIYGWHVTDACLGHVDAEDAKAYALAQASEDAEDAKAYARREAERQKQLDRQTKQATAWALTKEAYAAARNGDCNAVSLQSATVRGLDPDFHAAVFVRDVAIKRCLDAAAPAPVTAPAPPVTPQEATP